MPSREGITEIASSGSMCAQERPWIDGAANGVIDPIVEMRWSIPRVPRISYISECVSGSHGIARLETAVPVEMRIVVHLPAGAQNVDDLSAERVGRDTKDNSLGRAEHRSAAPGKYVYALM